MGRKISAATLEQKIEIIENAIGRNREQYDRAKKGANFGIIISPVLAEVVGVLIFFLAPIFIKAFGCEGDALAIP